MHLKPDEAKLTGLTQAEVEERVERGQTNQVEEAASRTYGHIIRANVFTRFNTILGTLLVIILIFGALPDALFGMVIVVNALIGIIQEIRAKRMLDRLRLVTAPTARALRDGNIEEIPIEGIVLDDVLELRSGDQIAVDGEALSADGLEMDESLITGESVPVTKHPGDEILSGSFVAAGAGRIRATKVGEDTYARKLASEARKFGLVHSELRDGINVILRWMTFILVPVGVLLLISQIQNFHNFRQAVPGTVAGLVGMVPEGLVLLTSVAFAVSVVTLGRRNVLVQELPAVEGLARVNTVCLDKTGTITDGSLVFQSMEDLGNKGEISSDVADALGAFALSSPSRNSTLEAIAQAFPPPAAPGWARTGGVAFSSARKWSAESYEGKGTWVLGAPEMVLDNRPPYSEVLERAAEAARSGLRVLLLAHSQETPEGGTLPRGLEAVDLLLFEDKVRDDAAETLRYFADQNVSIKVISGDNPETVAAVAASAGIQDAGEPFDARDLPTDAGELAAVMQSHTVFGRVTPHQKESMVLSLQQQGSVVAMTGDGVNDVMALKKADMGIAMGSGSQATKAVAQLVLIDGKFATLPLVVAEGRRVIANIERVANLFLTKTIYAMLLSVIIGLASWEFFFLPRHLTLISTLTIGTPALFLSLAPNKEQYHPGFLARVLRFAIPAGIIAALATLAAGGLSRIYYGINLAESRTMATLVLGMVSFWVLIILARPFNWWRYLLVGVLVTTFVSVLLIPGLRNIFILDLPGLPLMVESVGIGTSGILLLELIWRYTGWRTHRKHRPDGNDKTAGERPSR